MNKLKPGPGSGGHGGTGLAARPFQRGMQKINNRIGTGTKRSRLCVVIIYNENKIQCRIACQCSLIQLKCIYSIIYFASTLPRRIGATAQRTSTLVLLTAAADGGAGAGGWSTPLEIIFHVLLIEI